MNSATFNAGAQNAASINAILDGAVAVSGLSATPTQAELTTAWKNETGLTDLINRAQILDSDNSKVWTYYTNTQTWYDAPAGGTVSINTFTNNSEGVIKGSTNVGQVFAESDGTGSVNGWDALDTRVTNNTNAMLTVGAVLSQPSSVAYVDTANIVDRAVTAAKIDFSTLGGSYSTTEQNTGFTWIDGKEIYKKTVDFGPGPNGTNKIVYHNIANIDKIVRFEGFGVSLSGNYTPIPYSAASPSSLMDIAANTTNIHMSSGDNRSNWSFYITLYYTKTAS